MTPRKQTPNRKEADVIFASPEANRDLFWVTGFAAGDPFPFFQIGWRKYMIVGDLEIGRARDQAKVHHVLPLTRYQKRLKRKGVERPSLTDALIEALTERGVRRARVPHDFPVLAADRMRRAGIGVKPAEPPYWPARARKAGAEIEAIRSAVVRTEEAIGEGIDAIRRSVPRRGKLHLDGRILTSEAVRTVIHRALLDRGMTARETVVAGGEQAVNPHVTGSGPLRSGWPIVIDVFPRCDVTGYHADITRTVARGRPKPAQREMWEAVRKAQAVGCEKIAAGVTGQAVHQAVQKVFEDRGFETGPAKGGLQGFFHGTGHGLGLAVHEPPGVGVVGGALEAGNVITVEPGLYYPGLGGVRIEDDVVVREGGAENLVTLEKVFVL